MENVKKDILGTAFAFIHGRSAADNFSDSIQAEAKKATVLTKFKPFTKLPPELQINIWKHAIPPPRLVRVNVHVSISTIRFSTNTPVPALLSTCQTSRQTILSVYKTCLESGGKKIRMDGANDVLVLSRTSYWLWEGEPEYHDLPWFGDLTMDFGFSTMFSSIKNLAMPNDHDDDDDLVWFLSWFRSLKRYFALEGWEKYNLNTAENNICLEVLESDLARLELNSSAEWRGIRGLTGEEEEDHAEKMKELLE